MAFLALNLSKFFLKFIKLLLELISRLKLMLDRIVLLKRAHEVHAERRQGSLVIGDHTLLLEMARGHSLRIFIRDVLLREEFGIYFLLLLVCFLQIFGHLASLVNVFLDDI
jgi:hypothetical protein